MDRTFSLSEINLALRELVQELFYEAIWITAEISEVRVQSNGHCYLELIERDSKQKIIARQRATIWATQYAMLSPYFEQVAQRPLAAGMQVMVLANIAFHEIYGFSFNIVDINPEYTLGKIVSEKAQILQRLEDEGVLTMNQELDFPVLPKRVAVISSTTAAGLEDFCHQLQTNSGGYGFRVELFGAKMQGRETEAAVVAALDQIFERADEFDVVAIIRGGGATADLDAFNSYEIAMNITQFPLPVLSGIGHQRDETVIDLVSHHSLKTPTAVAEYLISCFEEQDVRINSLKESLLELVENFTSGEEQLLDRLTYNLALYSRSGISQALQRFDNWSFTIKSLTRNQILSSENSIERYSAEIPKLSRQLLEKQYSRLSFAQKSLSLLSPQNILRKGYTLIRQDGKIVPSADRFNPKGKFDIIFHDGEASVGGK